MSQIFSTADRQEYPSASTAVVGVVQDIVETGLDVGATSGSATKASGSFTECLGHSFVLTNPLDRMFQTDRRALNLSVAVARFVWMMSGSNRLADIAFYEPKVAGFTDDGYSVPGSSYGQRIFQSSPGVDQLRSVIDRIKADPNTRRATVSIYQPTDATRESKDIPCTFGLMYHPRNQALNATTIMRSNNALGLLEFNIFEFSLLAEIVAAEAGLELGHLLHFAGSMHAFESSIERWNSDSTPNPVDGRPMEPMPRNGNTLDQVTDLIKFEAEMRHESSALVGAKSQNWIKRVQAEFEPYWQQFAYILLLAVAKRNADAQFWSETTTLLNDEFRPFYPESDRPSAEAIAGAQSENVQDLFSFESAPKLRPLYSPRAKEQIVRLAEQHETRTGQKMPVKEFAAVEHELMERIAARGLDFEAAITEEEFNDALESVSEEND